MSQQAPLSQEKLQNSRRTITNVATLLRSLRLDSHTYHRAHMQAHRKDPTNYHYWTQCHPHTASVTDWQEDTTTMHGV